MVGLDATVIVEGRDLVSLKLLEADMKVTMKPPSSPGQRQGMKVRVRVEDISLRDLQVLLHLSSENIIQTPPDFGRKFCRGAPQAGWQGCWSPATELQGAAEAWCRVCQPACGGEVPKGMQAAWFHVGLSCAQAATIPGCRSDWPLKMQACTDPGWQEHGPWQLRSLHKASPSVMHPTVCPDDLLTALLQLAHAYSASAHAAPC